MKGEATRVEDRQSQPRRSQHTEHVPVAVQKQRCGKRKSEILVESSTTLPQSIMEELPIIWKIMSRLQVPRASYLPKNHLPHSP